MTNAKQQFAARLKKAMETAGYEAKPEVLEKRGSWRATIPQQELDVVDAFLALPVQQRKIVREVILAFAKVASWAKRDPSGATHHLPYCIGEADLAPPA